MAFALGFGVWIVGAVLSHGLMLSLSTGSVAFAIQNLIFGVACSRLHPHKDKDKTTAREKENKKAFQWCEDSDNPRMWLINSFLQ